MVGSNAPPQKTLNDLYDLGFARVVLPTFQPLLVWPGQYHAYKFNGIYNYITPKVCCIAAR